nr:immunoglobulin heavy chain junction region [Mus musculus]MBK4195060.1 immunoglobulin heavy chain junction region [Mus musculus]MBK4195061.1 immunoglobulin heavy chain junction region [Mus musculus]MBK4195389.1 immunoglobulin heavy chain junction region [Mus musculus]MBK4195390.1 immunoglobulin heavy chain junction region [Mus musculus]
CVRLRRMDYW